MNPSDDKSAAPDGVVVPRVEFAALVKAAQELCAYGQGDWDQRERLREAGKAFDVAMRAMLAAAPPPASPDERLKIVDDYGLRTAVLEECAKVCEAIGYDWHVAGANQKVYATEYLVAAIRALKIAAAQKDQGDSAAMGRPVDLIGNESAVRAVLHSGQSESHQQAARPEAAGQVPGAVMAGADRGLETQPVPAAPCTEPEAAVGSGGSDPRAALSSSPAAEHCLPAAASPRFTRARVHDRRIAHGDDFAGDAWISYTAVGVDANDPAAPCADGPSDPVAMLRELCNAAVQQQNDRGGLMAPWLQDAVRRARELLLWHEQTRRKA